jgi:hypothetical protein
VHIALHVQLRLTDQCRAWQARQLRLRWGFDQPRPFARAQVIVTTEIASLRCACRCYGKNRRSNKQFPRSRGPGETCSKGKQGASKGNHATVGGKQNTSGAASGSGKGSRHSGNNVSSSGKGTSSSSRSASSSSSSTPFAGVAAGVAAASSETLGSKSGKPDNHDIDDNISDDDDDDITPEENEYIEALLKSLHEDPRSSHDSDSDGSGNEPVLPGQQDTAKNMLDKMQDEEAQFAENELADAERSSKAKGTFNKMMEAAFQRGLDAEAAAELLLAAERGCEDRPPDSNKTTLESAELQGPRPLPDRWHGILLSWAEAFRECIASVSKAVGQAESQPNLTTSSVALVKIISSSKSLGDTWSYELVHVDQIDDACLHLRRIGEKNGLLGYLPKSSGSKHAKETVSVLIPNIGVGMVRPKDCRAAVPNHIVRVMQLLDMASGPSILSMFASCSICCRYNAAADTSDSQEAGEMGFAIPNPIAHCIVVLLPYYLPFASLV